MGLFGFSKVSTSDFPWTNIESVDQLNAILTDGGDKPKLLFKHSTRCSISAMVLKSFQSTWSSENEHCELYMIDLLKHRDVSNAIAEQTGVVHQSPQAILVKGSEVLYNASHSGIDARNIESTAKQA